MLCESRTVGGLWLRSAWFLFVMTRLPPIVTLSYLFPYTTLFRSPDVIDPYRRNLTPLSFGAGRHFCLGVHLAKLEAQIAWWHLARRLPFCDVAVTEIEYERRAFIRTPRRMIVRQAKRRLGA